MLGNGVVFLISGPSHLANLVVSIHTLRVYGDWQGSIEIHVFPESLEIVQEIAEDKRLSVSATLCIPGYRGKNEQFIQKILTTQQTKFEAVLYLDADTTVHKPIDEIFRVVEECGFVATQFNDWMSNTGGVRRRIERLIDREGIDQQSVQVVLNQAYPSVNGGVFAARRDSSVLPFWYDWTMAVKDIFIADETALHALQHYMAEELFVLRGGYWNCSPKYQPNYLRDDEVIIRHYHGDSNLRPDKSKKGVELWWPIYQECRKLNIGNINEWIDKVNNRHLSKLEREGVHHA